MADEQENGKWVTINGAHVFIKDGQTVEEALANKQGKYDRKIYRVIKNKKTRDGYEYGVYKFLNKYGYDRFLKDNPDAETKIFENWPKDLEERLGNLIENFDFEKQPYRLIIRDLGGYGSESLERHIRELITEYQEDRAQEYLKSIPKHKDTMVEESLSSINREHWLESAAISVPPYNNKALAYYNNCQRCVQAFVMRWCHGYDVEALPCDDYYDAKGKEHDGPIGDLIDTYARMNGYFPGWNSIIFNVDDVRETYMDGDDLLKEIGYSGCEDQERYIKRRLKADGPGACYIIGVTYKGGEYAHTVVAVNDGGKIKFLDPQDGKECTIYKDKNIRPKDTRLFRADTCRLNGDMMKYIFKKGGSNND